MYNVYTYEIFRKTCKLQSPVRLFLFLRIIDTYIILTSYMYRAVEDTTMRNENSTPTSTTI